MKMYAYCNQSVYIYLFACYGEIVGGISMAIKGFLFTKARDKSRIDIITNFIWSLNFTKERSVHIAYDETISEISAKLTSARYLIKVRPDTELKEIKELLLKKKYIKVEENKILRIIDDECAILKLYTIDKKEIRYGLEFIDHIALKFIGLLKDGLSNSQPVAIEMSECYTTRKIKIEIKDDKLFVNAEQVQGKLTDIAKQIAEDIEENIENWSLFYYGNLHSVEEYQEKDWKKFHVKEVEQELSELKSIVK